MSMSKAVWCRKVESSHLVYDLRLTNSVSFTASGTQVSMQPRCINNVVYPYIYTVVKSFANKSHTVPVSRDCIFIIALPWGHINAPVEFVILKR